MRGGTTELCCGDQPGFLLFASFAPLATALLFIIVSFRVAKLRSLHEDSCKSSKRRRLRRACGQIPDSFTSVACLERVHRRQPSPSLKATFASCSESALGVGQGLFEKTNTWVVDGVLFSSPIHICLTPLFIECTVVSVLMTELSHRASDIQWFVSEGLGQCLAVATFLQLVV